VITFIPKHASNSAISAYTRCAKAYELDRVLKFPQPPAWYLIAGSAVHTAAEHWDCGKGTSPSELFVDAFHDEIARARSYWPDDSQWAAAGEGQRRQTYNHWFAKGQQYLEEWASTSFPGALVDVELDVSTVLPSGIEVKAFVDRLYQPAPTQWVIWDLKSGSRRPDSDQQLGIYKVLTREWLRKQPGSGPIEITAANFMFKDRCAYEMDVSAWTLETVDQIAQTFVSGVKNQIFLPVRSADCGRRCGVAEACYLQSGDTPVTRVYDTLNPNYGK
jgi:hypothetical protein